MDGEVQKSYSKMAALHDELGATTFDAWRNEHSKEILTKEQHLAVEEAQKDVPS